MYASIRTPSLALVLMLLLSACGGGGGGGGGDDDAGPTSYYVDPQNGSDANPGTQDEPFRSITKGLSLAQDGEAVRLRKGSYGLGNGETFPLVVPPGVSLLGNTFGRGKGVNIIGFGRIESALDDPALTIYATLVPGENSRISGLTLKNVTGHFINDTLDVTIAAAYSGAVINACRIELAEDSGIRMMNGARGVVVRDCHISGSGQGIIFVGNSGESVIEGTTLTENGYGVMVFFETGVSPDLGGGSLGSKGGNTLTKNLTADLFVAPGLHVSARSNSWDGFPEPDQHVGNVGVPNSVDIWLYATSASVDVTGARSLNPPLAPTN